jgi:hypothetical protein
MEMERTGRVVSNLFLHRFDLEGSDDNGEDPEGRLDSQGVFQAKLDNLKKTNH